MRVRISLREALENSRLLGPLDPTWTPMKSLLLAAMGEELESEERACFQQLTQRACEPRERVRRLAIIAGRRAGKSRASAYLALFMALFADHRANLSTGEKGVVLIIAQNVEQAKICFNYVVGIVKSKPVLEREIDRITAFEIGFKNGITISVRPANFRGLRGITCVAAICDEIAFWFQEADNSTNSDTEILNALKPALVTTHGMLIMISSPYARRGELFKVHSRHYGPQGDPAILVAQGESRLFNSTIDQREIDEAYAEDHSVASAEWGGQFRIDMEGFVSREAVLACVNPELTEIAPDYCETYSCFVDASTGAGGDAFTCAIGHLRDGGDILVVDAIRCFQPPFSPEAVISEISELCHHYNITDVLSDRFAGGFVAELFTKHGVSHDYVKENKSQLYTNLLGVINARKIELLDHKRLIQELIGLERRTGFAGADRIDHSPGLHDDCANAVAGLAQTARENGGFSVYQYIKASGRGELTLEEERKLKYEKERKEREAADQRRVFEEQQRALETSNSNGRSSENAESIDEEQSPVTIKQF
jgi:hypothetical protein